MSGPIVEGALDMFVGSAEMGAGEAIAFGNHGAAAPLGAAVVVHGADQFSTGLYKLFSNRSDY